VQRDQARLDRFLNEVRTALEITHPNVCRVHDIGEVDPSTGSGQAQHYISMEYVDGEDLASLLRRIGHLPQDKAVQIARQLCAGLAAAHEEGILHRDLKPANVMIDGRGRAKITDFGLAGLAEGIAGDEVRAGTPQYMSPEQHAGSEVTVKSDIYSLGLVLYELFTGKRAFEAAGLAEIRRLQQESTPTRPGSVVAGLDDAVERTILRCIERDPGQRPPSVLAVSAALPGGDPLAAALAAGETPSPEMVADAGEVGGLKPWVGALCFVLALAGLVGVVANYDKFAVIGKIAPEKPPEVLVAEAREIVREAGFVDPPTDSVFGFGYDPSYSPSDEEFLGSDPASLRPPPVFFWYRQSPQFLVPRQWSPTSSMVTPSNPTPVVPGMVGVRLDPQGRLLGLHAVPQPRDGYEQGQPQPDWTRFLQRTGVDVEQLRPAPPEGTPPVYCDRRWAWLSAYPDQPEVTIRIDAGSYRGRPVHFEVLAPWTEPWRVDTIVRDSYISAPPETGVGVIVTVIFGVAALLARRNLRLGRADRRGALRLAGFVFWVRLLGWGLLAHHVPSLEELRLFLSSIIYITWESLMMWVLYLALEPYVRRLWPDVLISWSRLLAGRIRDPMIGRDVVVGAPAGLGLTLWWSVVYPLVHDRLEGHSIFSDEVFLAGLAGMRQTAGAFVNNLAGIVGTPAVLLFVFVVLRLILRRSWAAWLGLVLLFPLSGAFQGAPFYTLLFVIVQVTVYLFVLIRFGYLAFAVLGFFQSLDTTVVLTADLSAWYAGRSLFALLVVAALAGWGFYVSLAGRRLFGEALLEPQIDGKRHGTAR
jgi:serine/threonine-protein kinase